MNEAVPLIARTVAARRDGDGVLLFEIDSDEMYFVTPTVHAILKLCDGSRTVADLEGAVAEQLGRALAPAERQGVVDCITQLEARQLVELWS